MTMLGKTTSLAATLLLLGSMPALPAAAQSAAAQETASRVRPGQIPGNAIRIPCCRCLDGSKETIRIDTGAVPWQVSSPGSSAQQTAVGASNAAWTNLSPAKWVGPPGAPTAQGDYRYQVQIHLPRCIIPGQVTIKGRFAGDNSVKAFFDNAQIAASGGTANYGFLPGSVTPFTATTNAPGLHTLTFVVTNSSGPTGLAVEASITRVCPKELEHSSAVPVEPAPIDSQ
jgi:hypothetical protein